MKKLASNSKTFYIYLVVGIVCILIALLIIFKGFKKFYSHPKPRPRETNLELIQSWMTIPYISKTYGVPEHELVKSLGITQNPNTSINDVALKLNITNDELISKIKTQIIQFQAEHIEPPTKKPLE